MALTYLPGVWQDALQVTYISYTPTWASGVFTGTHVASDLYLTYGIHPYETYDWSDWSYNTYCSYVSDAATYKDTYSQTYAATYFRDVACNVREISWV